MYLLCACSKHIQNVNTYFFTAGLQKPRERGSTAPRKNLRRQKKLRPGEKKLYKKITPEEQLQNGKLLSKNTTFCLSNMV